MKLSVSSGVIDALDLGRAAVRADQEREAFGHQVFEADGAVFVTNADFPKIHNANYVRSVTVSTPEGIARLVRRADREFESCGHRCFEVDFTTPPAFEARLVCDGYEPRDFVLMAAEHLLAGRPKPADLRLVSDPRGWIDAKRLKRLDWAEVQRKAGGPPLEIVGEHLADIARLKSPPALHWHAWVDGKARGMAYAWVGRNGIGQVEDVFVEPEFRHRGLATALIHRCVEECRARGAGVVVIVADAQETPKRMYASMGFQPVAVKRRYVRYERGAGA